MIPRTFPSTFAANGQQQMVVYSLPSITGLTAWIDYIPVKGVTTESATLENTYANGGYQVVDSLASLTGKQAWLDYIPVYEDVSYTKPWSTDAGGYIPTSALAALLLDFTSGRLDPRITFSRTTNATLTNSAGLVANAPMNLLTFSEQFDNAAWTKTGATVTANTAIAPDGATTADTLISTAGVLSSPAVTLVATSYTFSIWMRSRTGSVQTVPISIAGAAEVMTSVGTTWTRFSTTWNASAGSWNTRVGNSSANFNIEIWGAQLELGSTATTYNPTTVKNLLGFTENFDNAAWTKSNAFVQTNNLRWSEDFTNSLWIKGGTATASTPSTLNFPAFGNNVNQETVMLATAGTAATFSVVLSGVGTVYIAAYRSGGSAYEETAIKLTLTATPTRYSVTHTMVNSGNSGFGAVISRGPDGTATTVTATQAQLVNGTSAGDYKATYAAAAAVGYTDIYGQPFAQKLVENTNSDIGHYVGQDRTFSQNSVVTLSVYAKAGERSALNVICAGPVATGGFFDLSSETATVLAPTGGTVASNATITALGSGWYRCSVVLAIGATLPTAVRCYLSNSSTPALVPTYTGDGTSGIYIFGAQLADSASIDPYVYQPVAAPSSVAYYGPRFDYDPVTLAPKGLLIEEQRTNLLTYSEQFDNAAWVSNGGTVTANTTVAPNGATTADTLTGSRFQSFGLSSAAYTFSCYAKKLSGDNRFSVRIDVPASSTSVFDLNLGIVVSDGAGLSSTITAVGNGWYRCVTTVTNAIVNVVLFSANSGSSSTYVWGAQLEAGAFATSYIPTVASQVTRAADSASMIGNNFSSWYRQDQGTLFGEFVMPPSLASFPSTFGAVSDGSGNNQIGPFAYTSGLYTDIKVGGVSQGNMSVTGAPVSGANTKFTTAYQINNAVSAWNGTIGVVDTLVVLPVVNQFRIGVNGSGSLPINSTIKRIAYYNRRLSNTELQGITS